MMKPQITHTDLQSTLVDLRGDDAALQLLAEKFVKRYPEHVKDISTAFQDSDFSRLAEHIHRLRGALGIFHAERARNMAITLERKALRHEHVLYEEFTLFMSELIGVARELSAHLGNPDPIVDEKVLPKPKRR